MRLVVPFAALRAETFAAVRDAVPPPRGWLLTFAPTLGETGYWELLRDLWAGDESFILVEHDVVPHAGALAELATCPRNWCAFPYDMDGMVTTAFGCTKFAAPLLARHPDIPELVGPRTWDGLDSLFIAELHRRGETEHEHAPMVAHLHAY